MTTARGAVAGTRVVVVDHHDSYTYNLVHLLAGLTGDLPLVLQHDEVSANDVLGVACTHVELSPGPGDPAVPADFAVGRDVLRTATIPVLGVCLGMQGLVTSYGGHVGQVAPAHGDVAEVRHDGTDLFAGVPSPFKAVRYHSLAALSLPDGVEATAWCDGTPDPVEEVVMAFRHRDRPLWGVQFHPESILTEHGETLLANFLAFR